MTGQMTRPRDVWEYMAFTGRTQAAFMDAEGNHILVERDRTEGYGIVDPGSHITFKRLNRCRDIWPLTPLVPEADL